MAIKSYLFKSTKDDICKLKQQDDIRAKFEGIESTGIDPTTITKLESILSGEDYYNICERGNYSVIHRFNEDSGPVFVSSSTSLSNCLKEMQKNQKREILERWCETPEMSLYGWTPDKAEHIIDWMLSVSTKTDRPAEEIILFLDLQPEVTSVT